VLDGEDDQLAGVLVEPDAVGVLVEGHLAGVLVTGHLGLVTVHRPGVRMLLMQGHGVLLDDGSPQVVPGVVHLADAEYGSRDIL
jgi:hypothetical protein